MEQRKLSWIALTGGRVGGGGCDTGYGLKKPKGRAVLSV